jgi:hypothetical protein
MGLLGIWTGIPLGVGFAAICYNIRIFTTNWKKLSHNIAKRIKTEKKDLNLSDSVLLSQSNL